jgi:hypothetical protein
MRKPIDNQHPSGSTSAAGRTLAPNARHLTALNNFPCLRIRSLPPSPRANAQRPPTEAALRCNTRSCRFLGSAGTAPNRKSRTRNNRQREALAGFRSPCSHRRTGRRRWASFQRPGAGRPGKSGRFKLHRPSQQNFSNEAEAPLAENTKMATACRRRRNHSRARTLSIPDKWSLASHPILSFRRRAYRRPVPDPPERWTRRAWPVQLKRLQLNFSTRSVYPLLGGAALS